MAINFPNAPNINDTYQVGDVVYVWNGTSWESSVEAHSGFPIASVRRTDGVALTRTTSLALTTGFTQYAIPWENIERDDANYWVPSINPARVYAPRSGYYMIAVSGFTGGVADTYTLTITKNNEGVNSTPQTTTRQYHAAAIAVGMAVSAVKYLNQGEYIVVFASARTNTRTIETARYEMTYLGGPDAVSSPDTAPATANAMDDEFEGSTLLAKWADANIGSVTKTVAKGHLKLSLPTESPGNVRGVEQTLPASGSWRFEAKISQWMLDVNTYFTGIGIRENATGKALMHYRVRNNTPARGFELSSWNSFTSFGTSLVLTAANGYYPMSGPVYFSVAYDGSTNYTFQLSADGVVWSTIGTAANATYFTTLADRIGIYLFNNNTGATVELACDWFRRVS